MDNFEEKVFKISPHYDPKLIRKESASNDILRDLIHAHGNPLHAISCFRKKKNAPSSFLGEEEERQRESHRRTRKSEARVVSVGYTRVAE